MKQRSTLFDYVVQEKRRTADRNGDIRFQLSNLIEAIGERYEAEQKQEINHGLLLFH